MTTSPTEPAERCDLGPCCACGKHDETVRNLVLLEYEAPAGFQGWGCTICNLPLRGAQAVVCDECCHRGGLTLTHIMGGKWALEGERVDLHDYHKVPFGHDRIKHAQHERRLTRFHGLRADH